MPYVIGGLVLLAAGYFLLAGGYLLGTWIAVELLGASNPSGLRSTVGWICEIPWLVGIVYLAVFWYRAHERAEAQKLAAEEAHKLAVAQQKERERLSRLAQRDAETVERRARREAELEERRRQRAADRAATEHDPEALHISWTDSDEDPRR